MGISSFDLMGRSVIINVPSPSSSSSSSPSSSRVHQMPENEGDEDRINVEAKLSYRNSPCRKLGHHEAPRSILDDVENDEILNLEFEQLEQLEQEVLMLMIAKGLKGDKLESFMEEKGIKGFEVLKLNEKLNDLGIGMEEPKKCEKGKGVNVCDKKLLEEIKLLESMLERGSYGLVDLQMMMEEVRRLNGSEKMVSEIKMKMSELESELCELKESIVELKGKKSKELMKGYVEIEEEDKGLKCEEQEYEYEEEEDNASKIKWGSIFASVGTVVVAAAAVFLVGRSSVDVKSRRRNRDQTGELNFVLLD